MSKTLAESPVYKYRGWHVYQTYNDDGSLSDQIVIKQDFKSFVLIRSVTNTIAKTVKEVESLIDSEIATPGKFSSKIGYTMRLNWRKQ